MTTRVPGGSMLVGMRLLLGWFGMTVAVLVTVLIVPGVDVDWSPGVYWAIAAVLALVNITFGVILRLLSLPLLFVTWGLFSLVLNAILLLITDGLMDSLHVDSFWAALVGAAVIAVAAVLVEGITRSIETGWSRVS